jgi:hypothetical protein
LFSWLPIYGVIVALPAITLLRINRSHYPEVGKDRPFLATSPQAYLLKNIGEVMATQSELVTVVGRFDP